MGSIGAEIAEPPNQVFDTILCYDFGSQYDRSTVIAEGERLADSDVLRYSHLITRRLRDFNIYCELQPCTTKLSEIPFRPKGQ